MLVYNKIKRNFLAIFILISIQFFSVKYVLANNLTQEEIIYFPNKHSLSKLINLIDKAQKNIIISVYRIENEQVINSIIDAKKRGVDVKIILCNFNKSERFDYEGFDQKTFVKLSNNKQSFDRFVANNIKVVFSDNDVFFAYHPKFVVIDDKIGIIGTSNLNDNGFFQARNFFLITREQKVILELMDLFYQDFNSIKEQKWYNHIAVSPGNYFNEIFNVINYATDELYIYQTTLAHKPTCNKLMRIASSGIKIKILTSKRIAQEYSKDEVLYCENMLKNHKNIDYKYLNDPYYVHAKIILADPKQKTKTCFLGSSLFWNEGFTQSREVGIVTANNTTIKKIHSIFMKDFALAGYEYNGEKNID
jgi:phosphatidylserine/phosphatidylglycerophosphate/cardiolipin synthase-like enzyme